MTTPQPRPLSVTLILLAVLILGSWNASAAEPAAGPRMSYNVRDYGAAGDGKALDSPAIDKAIAAAAADGGGTVVLPAGTYLSGTIHFKSNITLHLAPGAVLLGAPQSLKAYDREEPFAGPAYQDGGHTYFRNSLIYGEGLSNIAVTGKGIIKGGGLTREDRYPAQPGVGNKAIAFKLCKNVLIRDVTILHGGHFAIIATGCDGLTVDNVLLDTNRDGIDIDCCRNALMANCRINAPHDDGLCLKSSYALNRLVLCENITITNCLVSGYKEGTLFDGTMVADNSSRSCRFGRIKFGTETNGGFRNVSISNCAFRQCRGLALEIVDGGIMEDITISNISMEEIDDYPIYITTGCRNRGPAGTPMGRIRNILISNVVASGIDPVSGIQITGMPGFPIEDVRLRDIRLVFNGGGTREQGAINPPELGVGYPEPQFIGTMPGYGLFARHVKGLELESVSVKYVAGDQRPAIVCNDIDGLKIRDFEAMVAPGSAAARFEAVKGLVVRDSPVLDGITPAAAPVAGVAALEAPASTRLALTTASVTLHPRAATPPTTIPGRGGRAANWGGGGQRSRRGRTGRAPALQTTATTTRTAPPAVAPGRH